MYFIQETDLNVVKTKNIINAVSSDDQLIKDASEMQAIEEVKSYLTGRYDVDMIFSKTGEERSPLIVGIVTRIMVYRMILRIVNDDIPEYIINLYNSDIQFLKDVAKGILSPSLPLRDKNMEATTSFRWGSTANFYGSTYTQYNS